MLSGLDMPPDHIVSQMRSILDFSSPVINAGEIQAMLANSGTPIGPYDVLIAGQARARELTLVSSNIREFQRIDGLSVDDWSS